MDIPQVVAGRFRIERQIGHGGMGTVYSASHLGLERRVAIKVLKQEFAADPEVADRFMREARTMARLRHPGAAMIFDAGRIADGRPFIVMEYVEGETLAETLKREGPLAPERAVRIAAEICEVLAEAHALGIVHRDLKPSNIILNERGVRVLDFGIAKVLANSTEVTRTHATTESGLVIGTPRYMSPEQCLGQRIGPASDLYSVGVLVYEMLAGRPPFTDTLSAAVLVKQATSAPPALLALKPDVPRSLAIATHTLLAKNPAHRPAQASEARRMLERSIAVTRREGAEVEYAPLASTINSLDAGRFAFIRVATVCVILAMLGATLLGWARGGASAGSSENAAAVASAVLKSGGPNSQTAKTASAASDASLRGATQLVPSPTQAATPSPESAMRQAAAVSPGKIGDARFVRAKDRQAIAAIYDETDSGATSLFIMERKGPRESFHVTERAPLDIEGFEGARWSQEVVDVDGDGFDEVLCTGTKARGTNGPLRRYVLHVPRTGPTYSLRVAPGARNAGPVRASWSPNIMKSGAQAFRHALRRRAFPDEPTL